MTDTPALRDALIAVARSLNAENINRGKAGNVSVRIDAGFLITPSGMPYAAIERADVVAMGADGRPQGARRPSSEWPMHHAIYAARPDVAAIVHTHAPFATALACLGRGIPAFHYMVAVAGGRDIRCAPYATFGTAALAVHTVAALAERRACLLAHHGMVATGASLEKALALAVEVEALAEIYGRALQIGTPTLLTDLEMDAVMRQFGAYGQAESGSG